LRVRVESLARSPEMDLGFRRYRSELILRWILQS
jgi:hypothetical protein